jgi:hypothetical protein
MSLYSTVYNVVSKAENLVPQEELTGTHCVSDAIVKVLLELMSQHRSSTVSQIRTTFFHYYTLAKLVV